MWDQVIKVHFQEKFEDTKAVNRSTIQWPTEKGQQHKQKQHRKLKIEQHEHHKQPG